MPTYQKGQVYVGSHVETAPVVFGAAVTTDAGIVAGGGLPTLGTFATLGTGSSIGSQVGTDQAGSFVLTLGTQVPTGGTQLSVTFATPLPSAPAAVVVNVADTTASATTNPAWGATAYSTTGFVIYGGVTTASHTYLVSYQVIRQN